MRSGTISPLVGFSANGGEALASRRKVRLGPWLIASKRRNRRRRRTQAIQIAGKKKIKSERILTAEFFPANAAHR
ncbi:hypothetical protein CDAR_241271 [Caerostris darwini]|uniref:Uncharacterized protein n=1 Tax=Caerostris darwini TaxID=1538125 RepID=A0AAV4THI5_9ARAC|nr:hypothetical protein CDAR_241271 [Caerostris darwini]